MLYHPTTCFVGNNVQVLTLVHANPGVQARINQLRGLSSFMRTRVEVSSQLRLTAADMIVLEQYLGRTHAAEFIRAVATLARKCRLALRCRAACRAYSASLEMR